MTYKEVVEKAKKTLEKRGEYNDGDVFLNACSLWMKGDQINLWSYWQGYQIEDIDKGVAHCGGMGSANVGGMNSMLKAWKKNRC